MKVIYEPPLPEEQRPQRPVASADQYRVGTVVRNHDGEIWHVAWDDQDKRHMWVIGHES